MINIVYTKEKLLSGYLRTLVLSQYKREIVCRILYQCVSVQKINNMEYRILIPVLIYNIILAVSVRAVFDFNDKGEDNTGGSGSFPEKRFQAFNSWGGKRNSPNSLSIPTYKIVPLKKSLNPWIGSEMSDNKRRGFNSWGGKRNIQPVSDDTKATLFPLYSLLENSQQYPLPRSVQVLLEQIKKRRFGPWGGKRTDVPELQTFLKSNGARESVRRAFSPWGGKRSDDVLDKQFDTLAADNDESNKRAFSAWGGK